MRMRPASLTLRNCPAFSGCGGVGGDAHAGWYCRWQRLAALGIGGLVATSAVIAAPGSGEATFVRDGVAGFVISDIRYALSGDTAGARCPDGMSLQVAEIFAQTVAGKRKPGESDGSYGKRVEAGGQALSKGPDGQDFCMNPEASKPDPYFRSLRSSQATALGIDLDGAASSAANAPAACAHNDFAGPGGVRGIDNQFYRVVGCSRSFLPEGQSNGFATEMLSGSWGILMTVSGIDDLRNDDDVEVGIFASADPIQLSPTRVPLEYATYAVDQDPRFQARTRGRIEEGVLTTDPVDVRFHHVVNSMRLERPLRDARIEMTLSAEGVLDGYMAGYTPVEAMYDFQFGYREGKDGSGALAPLPLRQGSANGAARVLGYTCPGIYHALREHADGHPDPATGQCTSISTQYQLHAIPAFVVDVATQSANAELDAKREHRDDY